MVTIYLAFMNFYFTANDFFILHIYVKGIIRLITGIFLLVTACLHKKFKYLAELSLLLQGTVFIIV